MRINMRRLFLLSISLLIGSVLSISGLSLAAEEKTEETGDIEYEAGFYYTVKKGDTLWDLSQRFNDTPWQWPDLWEENTQISNPHWIYPGERIRIFRKKDHHRYAKPQKEVEEPEAQITASAPEEGPPPEVHYLYANLDRVGFIRKPAVEPLGTIIKSRDDKTLISKDDYIYIKPSNSNGKSGFSPGMRLTVFRTLNPTDERSAEETIGTQHLMLGLAEIVRVESQWALAKILQNYRTIYANDLVMAYDPRNPQIKVIDSTPDLDGKIIVSEDHTKLIGELFIAFIDKGKEDNVLPGQVYDLYYQETAGQGKSTMLLDKVNIGSFLVLHTEQTTSTVVVTDSSKQLLPGQPFHSPGK